MVRHTFGWRTVLVNRLRVPPAITIGCLCYYPSPQLYGVPTPHPCQRAAFHSNTRPHRVPNFAFLPDCIACPICCETARALPVAFTLALHTRHVCRFALDHHRYAHHRLFYPTTHHRHCHLTCLPTTSPPRHLHTAHARTFTLPLPPPPPHPTHAHTLLRTHLYHQWLPIPGCALPSAQHMPSGFTAPLLDFWVLGLGGMCHAHPHATVHCTFQAFPQYFQPGWLNHPLPNFHGWVLFGPLPHTLCLVLPHLQRRHCGLATLPGTYLHSHHWCHSGCH